MYAYAIIPGNDTTPFISTFEVAGSSPAREIMRRESRRPVGACVGVPGPVMPVQLPVDSQGA